MGHVLLPCHLTFFGGTLLEASRLNLHAEMALAACLGNCCLAIDFMKLFNTIDPIIAAKINGSTTSDQFKGNPSRTTYKRDALGSIHGMLSLEVVEGS